MISPDKVHLAPPFQDFLVKSGIIGIREKQPEVIKKLLEQADQQEKAGIRVRIPLLMLRLLEGMEQPIASTDNIAWSIYNYNPEHTRETTERNLQLLRAMLKRQNNGLPILYQFPKIGWSTKAQSLILKRKDLLLLHKLWKKHDEVVTREEIAICLDARPLRVAADQISFLKKHLGGKVTIERVYGKGYRMILDGL